VLRRREGNCGGDVAEMGAVLFIDVGARLGGELVHIESGEGVGGKVGGEQVPQRVGTAEEGSEERIVLVVRGAHEGEDTTLDGARPTGQSVRKSPVQTAKGSREKRPKKTFGRLSSWYSKIGWRTVFGVWIPEPYARPSQSDEAFGARTSFAEKWVLREA
jgi:hypothetical protein